MNYEEKYKEALERMKSWVRGEHPECFCEAQKAAEFIFPELKEDNDERVRKGLIKAVSRTFEGNKLFDTDVTREEALAWLEKQGEQKIDNSNTMFNACINALRNVGHSHLAAWLEKQGENNNVRLVEEIKRRKELLLSEKKKALSQSEKLSLGARIAMLDELLAFEKQGEQPTDKFEPKFKVGDWLQYRYAEPFLVEEITEQGYCNGNSCLPFEWEDEIHLWTIRDAKDGDVLVDSYSKDSIIILYKGIYKERSVLAHCGWNGYNLSIKTNVLGYGGLDNTDYLPATKEQRDLFFSKMKQEGYEWDNEKKKLWLLKQPLKITPKFCVGQVITDDNGTWYKITNIKCLEYYELYDACEDTTHLELCSIIDEKFRENRFVSEIKKMMGD